jgi:hypothetical protein
VAATDHPTLFGDQGWPGDRFGTDHDPGWSPRLRSCYRPDGSVSLGSLNQSFLIAGGKVQVEQPPRWSMRPW